MRGHLVSPVSFAWYSASSAALITDSTSPSCPGSQLATPMLAVTRPNSLSACSIAGVDGRTNPFGDLGRARGRRIGQDHDEFLAAIAGGGVRGTPDVVADASRAASASSPAW